MATKKAVAKTKEASLAPLTELPEHLKKGSVRGTETLTSEDLLVPALSLIQATSPQVNLGHTPGKFYHNILEKTLCDDPDVDDKLLSFIPIIIKVRHVLWRPRHMDGGRLATAEDGIHWDKPNQEFEVFPNKDDKGYKEVWRIGETVDELTMCPDENGNYTKSVGDFGTSDTRNENAAPASTKSYVVLARALHHLDQGPFVVYLQRTSEKPGRVLNQKIRQAGVDSFGLVFKMSSVFEDKGADNKYHRFAFESAGYAPVPVYEQCEEDYNNFKDTSFGIQGEEELAQESAPSGGGAPGADGAPLDDNL